MIASSRTTFTLSVGKSVIFKIGGSGVILGAVLQ